MDDNTKEVMEFVNAVNNLLILALQDINTLPISEVGKKLMQSHMISVGGMFMNSFSQISMVAAKIKEGDPLPARPKELTEDDLSKIDSDWKEFIRRGKNVGDKR